MASKRTSPLSVRLSPELNERLESAAEKLRMRKHTLAQDAIEAAVEAIERNGYRLVVPIEFEVTHVPTKKKTDTYPPRRVDTPELNAPGPSSESKKADQEVLGVIEKHYPTPKGARRK